MTIDQVLEVTVEILNGIMIPVGLMEKVGVPISHAVGNLQLCVEEIRKESAPKEEEADEPEADAE